MARLTPKVEIFGLEISDGLVRFYDTGKRGNKNARQFVLRLPPEAVVGGKVENKEVLVNTLKELHKRVVDSQRKSISVILTVPSTNIYIQPFSLPIMASNNVDESAELNMRMISPIDADSAYYDWQNLGEAGDHISMMGAFANRDIMDAFSESVQEAGFNVAAVEFMTLSLVRAAMANELIDKEKPNLLVQIDQAGLGFAISQGGDLYFHHFTGWDRYRDGDKTISLPKFKDGVVDEVRRTINFASTNFNTGEIKEMVLVASSFTDETVAIVGEQFKDLQVKPVGFDQLNAAMGAALRARVPRSQDTAISLAGFSAIDVFRKDQLGNFVSIWRNIIFTTFGLLLFIFLGAAVAMQQTGESVVQSDPFQTDIKNSAELVGLEKQAREFNSLVDSLSGLVSHEDNLYAVMQRVATHLGPRGSLVQLSVSNEGNLVLQGVSASESQMNEFRERMREDEWFEQVQLPLDRFATNPDGTISFTLRAVVVR